MTEKTIEFYILIDKRISKNGKIHFELYKTDRFQSTGKKESIKCILPIPEAIFKEPKFIAKMNISENNVATGTIENLEKILIKNSFGINMNYIEKQKLANQQ